MEKRPIRNAPPPGEIEVELNPLLEGLLPDSHRAYIRVLDRARLVGTPAAFRIALPLIISALRDNDIKILGVPSWLEKEFLDDG